MSKQELAIHAIAISLLISLAVVSTYYPQYLLLTFFTFLGFITIAMYSSYRASRKPPKLFEVVADDIYSGTKLYEVDADEVSRLVEKDLVLYDEIRRYSYKSLIDALGVSVVFGWYFLYFYIILPRLTVTDLTIKFIVYLIGYGVPYIAYLGFDIMSKRSSTLTYVLRGYEVYDRGIISRSQYIAIKFPLKDYTVKEFPTRKCIQLSKKHEGYIIRFMLYAKNMPKIMEILREYGDVAVEN